MPDNPKVFRTDRFEFDDFEVHPPVAALKASWDEGKHPRDDDGKFGEGGGGGSSTPDTSQTTEPNTPKDTKKPKEKKPAPSKEPVEKPEEEAPRNYRDFGSFPETTVADAIQPSLAKPSKIQAQALEYYRTNEGALAINKAMRTGQPLSPEAAKNAKALDSYLNNSRIEHDTMLYRGIDPAGNRMKQFTADVQSGKLAVGSTMSDKGFASTSLNGAIASEKFSGEDGGVVFKIKAPKGTPGAYMNTAMDRYTGKRYESEFRDEREMLLPSNSQYKVGSISREGNKYVVEMTYLGIGTGSGKSAVMTNEQIAHTGSIQTILLPHPRTMGDGILVTPNIEHAYFTGGAIKAIGIGGDGRIGGYLVVWGSANKTDSGGEWFTADTDLSLEAYAQRPVLYHHGLSDIKTTVIGTITSLKKDETGVYAEAILDINHEDPQIRSYARSAYDMVRAGKLGWSSGSAPNLVEVEPSGHIKRWMIVEGSLTPTPAEPQRTTVSAIKSAISALETEVTNLPKETRSIEAKVVKTVKGVHGSHSIQSNKRKLSIKMGTVIEALEGAGDLSPEQIIAVAKALEASGIGALPVEAVDPVEPDLDDATMAIDDVAAPTPPETDVPVMAKAKAAVQPQGLSMAQVKKEIEMAMKSARAKTPVPGLTTANPGVSFQNDIVMQTPTHSLSAEDLSYMIHMRTLMGARTGNAYKADVKLVRELAVKAQKQIQAGTTDLGFDAETKENVNNRYLAIKANELDNTQNATGAGNWVPELWSAELWRRVRVEDRVIGQFQVVEMPSATYDLPVESTDPTVYFVPETTENSQLSLASGAAIPSSVVGASKVQLIAKKLALRVGFSTEMMEDSIIPFIPQLRDQALITMQNAIEYDLENGDTTNSGANINGTPSGATDKFLAFNGMRYLGLITNTQVALNASGATPTLQMIRQARFRLISALNSYALDPARLVIVVDQFTYGQMLNIDELLAWYNNGQGSTVNTGIMPKIDGIDVVPSAQLPLTDATGVVNGTSSLNIYGTMLIASKDSWKVGYRRQVTSSLDYLPYYDSYQLTNTVRIAFKNKDTIANAVIYGLYTGYPAT